MNSNDLILKRKNLTSNITKYWRIIRQENITKKQGPQRNYDLRALLAAIEKMGEELITIKLLLQCINMGLTDKEDYERIKKDSNYTNIYMLQQKKEMLKQLSMIPTLNTKMKTIKGKSNLKVSEELTKNYIRSIQDKLQIEVNSLDKAITDFNDNTEISFFPEEIVSSLAA